MYRLTAVSYTHLDVYKRQIYYHRWFYVMFLPVLIMILLFNYWPMLGCRYAFTKYIIRSPYYVGLLHFNTMFTNDVFFWDAFRNTLLLSIVKLILNTGAAVIISLLLNEITNLAFKKTVQTIVYLPHFMSWVVAVSYTHLDGYKRQHWSRCAGCKVWKASHL